ncbi:MBL fold metallo-hydrolase [Candidatus Dependentiae bacterium]|nr:MBL fold metallo-hydrolase [Candidatus Dependentiae bacterium]
MKISKHICAIKIPFEIPVSPEKKLSRLVYSYIILGDTITIIDTGVANSYQIIIDYIKHQGRKPKEISHIIHTHSHPDHIGATYIFKNEYNPKIIIHKNGKKWLEDTQLQYNQRPVPGFNQLVSGSVPVDKTVENDEIISLDPENTLKIIHTPGHSDDSISLYHYEDKVLFTGDTIPGIGDLPVYTEIDNLLKSIEKIKKIQNIDYLLSSWAEPKGKDAITDYLQQGIEYLLRIHNAVLEISEGSENIDKMILCKKAVEKLGLPPLAINPILATSFYSNYQNKNIFCKNIRS